MILSRYLVKAFLSRFTMLLVGLVLFLQTLDLLATADEIMAGGGDAMASLARYVMLRAPSLIETVAPLATLLGALTAMVGMATTSEILAMRAAGLSVLRLVGGLVGVGLAMSLLLFAFSEAIVVPSNSELQGWRDDGFRSGEQPAQTGENSWVMEGSTFIRVGNVLRDGAELINVRLFIPGTSGEIAEIISIGRALWDNNAWTTSDMSRLHGPGGSDSAPLTWQTQLRSEHFIRFSNHPNELSLNALQQYIGDVAIRSRPGYFYDTWVHQKFAGPIVLALMPLLAAIAAFAHHRQGSSVVTVVWGISIGFAFIVIDNIVLAMGQFGSLPPMLAAWLPIALFGTLGLWLVFSLEHTGART